ncbi:MAG: response regulator, partial [Candidatus Electrothrix sp. AR3]|nr:response regulator [Candidatus Electrothrix sp. AR3]
RKKFPDVKIITISGGGRMCPNPALFLEAARGLGSLLSFRKPLDRVEFLAAVDKILPFTREE